MANYLLPLGLTAIENTLIELTPSIAAFRKP
jgi:hypothetical protein